MLNNIRSRIANLISPIQNSMTLPQEFLKYGNNKGMTPDWTQVIMSDKDFYTGYSYAAIRNRLNAVARLATSDNLKTDSTTEGTEHPYLDIISKSPTFTNYRFWSEISLYLDLEGVYYLMAVRATEGERVGKVQEFKMLNPYNVKPVWNNTDTGIELGGFVESRDGRIREIPKEMIIPIREVDPFDDKKTFAMTDAAKSSQFTLKTADDYSRHALRNNINAPGILSTGVVLPPEQFKNFMARVTRHTKGEPLFSNGSDAINWESMQTELSKAALKDVNEIKRDELLSVAGVSKTAMGIEQSGTTRETAKVQTDLLIVNQVLPRIQLIADALNQDYENNYPNEFASQGSPTIVIINPTATDHDADIKQNDVRTKNFDLYQSLLNKGYDAEIAAQYVNGDITLAELGEPTNEPVAPPITEPTPPDDDDDDDIDENKTIPTKNQFEQEQQGIVQQSTASLQNAIVNADGQLVAAAINSIQSTSSKKIKKETDLVTKSEQQDTFNELTGILASFYGVILTLEGPNVMRKRNSEFIKTSRFVMGRDMLKSVKRLAKKVSKSHVGTVMDDIFVTAREGALENLSQEDLINRLTTKYSGQIAETRAKTVARTETNRAFTTAQFEADEQFVKQNKLEGRAFKQWRTRSDNPCPFCKSLEAEGPVPFSQDFRSLGDTVEVDGKTLEVGFEALSAGNAHPNCACIYELIVNPEKNALEKSEKNIVEVEKRIDQKTVELEKQMKELNSIL